MSSLQIGQKVEIDVFGLRLSGFAGDENQVTGTIVEMGPGTITVRVEKGAAFASEVTVSPGRLRF
jgi:hypothetical protein